MTSRPYQLHILDRTRQCFAAGRRRILVISPTGSGKTRIFCIMAGEAICNFERVLILVDQDELVWQAVRQVKEIAGFDCEVEKAEHSASHDAVAVVASVQTMVRRLAEWPSDHFGLIIADEADKSLAATWSTVLRHFSGRICGFTATPNRTDGRNLGEFYEEIAADIKLPDLLPGGKWAHPQHWLSPITVKMLPVKIDLSAVRSSGADFNKDDLADAILPHLREIAGLIKEHAANRRILVFVPLIATSIKFVSIFAELGLKAEHIDGNSEDRAEKIERFQRAEFSILINSQLLARGVDIPCVDCIAPVRPIGSLTFYQQCIGRGTRLFPGKKDLLLLDFLFQAKEKMVCRPAHLIFSEPEDIEAANEISSGGMPAHVIELLNGDLQQSAQQLAQHAREGRLRKAREATAHREATTISPEQLFGERELIQDSTPITDDQRRLLAKVRIDTNGKTYTEGAPSNAKPLDLTKVHGQAMASKILNHVTDSRNKGVPQASPAQKHLLKRMGYDGWQSATPHQFRRFMAEVKA